jgi:AcrR family transcriptional regulator
MAKIQPAAPTPYHHGDLRRALIDAALELVTEEQNWNFSLREVARRAGVSHNAPYNHFRDKKELLAELAAVGFERLQNEMVSATAGIDDPAAALAVTGRTYVTRGVQNPALYRLMFGSDLADSAVARAAGAKARKVVEELILLGARSGVFAIPPDNKREVALVALSAYSNVHGLTMLIIDKRVGSDIPIQTMIERVGSLHIAGMRTWTGG